MSYLRMKKKPYNKDDLYRCAVQMCCMRNSAHIFTFICVNKPEISSSVDEFSFKMKIVKVTRKLL